MENSAVQRSPRPQVSSLVTCRRQQMWSAKTWAQVAGHEISCAWHVHVWKKGNMQCSLGIKVCQILRWIRLRICPWDIQCFTPSRMGFIFEMTIWGWGLWTPRGTRRVCTIVWLPTRITVGLLRVWLFSVRRNVNVGSELQGESKLAGWLIPCLDGWFDGSMDGQM